MTMDAAVCRTLGQSVDWDEPQLRQTAAARAWHGGDAVSACAALMGHLRRSARPGLGLPAQFITQLRCRASDQERQAAERAWEGALQRDLYRPYHSNTFAALGAERIALVATAARCRAAAEVVLSRQAEWGEFHYCFGDTHGICQMIHHFWSLPECPDECLIPALAWLTVAGPNEWQRMRKLTEAVLGPSGHNWYAHSFHGFFMAGCWFPELGFARFRALGGAYLERELALLFQSDGWSKEGAPGYHLFALHNLLAMADLAAGQGMAISTEGQERLRTIADAHWRLLAPDGGCPGFGDDNRGGQNAGDALANPGARPTTMLRRYAARFNLPEAKFVAESLDPIWSPPFAGLLPEHGIDLMPSYQALVAKAPPELDSHLPHSGLYVMRQDWTRQSDYLALLAGPLGEVVTSHKHADLFTFELYSRGRRLLVDNGYGSEVPEARNDPRFRMWRISSAAHNVATIDGQDHLPIQREYRFRGVVTPLVDVWRSTPQYAYFSGVHEGYRHLHDEVTACRRKLFYRRGEYWILIDRFTPSNQVEHEYAQHFHLAVDCQLEAAGRVVTRGVGGNLLIVPVPDADGQASLEANPFPVQGYENPRHLCYRRRSGEPWLFVTLMIPFLNDSIPKVEVRLLPVECDGQIAPAWETTGLEIRINGRRDVHVDHHMHWNLPWRCGDCAGVDRLFHQAQA